MIREFIGFDLETAPAPGCPQEFALQPWRVRRGEARITWASMAREDGRSRTCRTSTTIQDWLREPQPPGAVYVAWNAVFDLAWSLAYGLPVDGKRWVDGVLLWKWWDSDRTSYHLAEAVQEWLPAEKHPWVPQYLALKEAEKAAGFQTENTETYVAFDAYAAALVSREIYDRLVLRYGGDLPKQFYVEQELLVPVARSWLQGIPYDTQGAREVGKELQRQKDRARDALGLSDEVLSSPDQLCRVLYEEWKWPVQFTTPKGKPSTDKTALTYATDHDDRAVEILKYREANTRLSKFVQTALEAEEYLGDNVMHPAPRIFSTYTGRFTYTARVLNRYPVGVALHQMPRGVQLRRLIVAPEGMRLVELDFAGQEMRLMGALSKDKRMLEVFGPGGHGDAHSLTGAEVGRVPFAQFMRRKKAGDPEIVGPKGLRYQGKFINLSLQYRTSAKTLRRKARVDYDFDATPKQAKEWYRSYHRLYPGVKLYWDRAIGAAKRNGFAETLGHRRHPLPRWRFSNPDHQWAAESTAINYPIQGTGADMKELGIAVALSSYDFLQFAFDLHDGLFFWVPEDTPDEWLLDVRHTLSHLPYNAAWGWVPPVELPVDLQVGKRWGEMGELQ